MKKAVVAFGGNFISKAEQKEERIEEQFNNIRNASKHLLPLIKKYSVLITNGNGPQVGRLLRRVELSSIELSPIPLDICVANTQGSMGYMLQEGISNILGLNGIKKKVVTLITQVIVDKKDPAFQDFTKPIGSFYNEKEAGIHIKKDKWVMKKLGKGWRRVVPSPKPLAIVEINEIISLSKSSIVICCGGGGIPVIKEKGIIKGVEAVIDKDRVSALLANLINADLFIILTDVPYASINYGKKNQTAIRNTTVCEIMPYVAQGHFEEGSMKPKIEAAISFLNNKKKKVIITCPEMLEKALKGKAGTIIRKG